MKTLLPLIFAVSLACLAADKVLIIALGDHIYDWDPPEMVDRFYASLEDKGIDAVWGVGGPLPWRPGNWKNPEYIEFINRTHAIIPQDVDAFSQCRNAATLRLGCIKNRPEFSTRRELDPTPPAMRLYELCPKLTV